MMQKSIPVKGSSARGARTFRVDGGVLRFLRDALSRSKTGEVKVTLFTGKRPRLAIR